MCRDKPYLVVSKGLSKVYRTWMPLLSGLWEASQVLMTHVDGAGGASQNSKLSSTTSASRKTFTASRRPLDSSGRLSRRWANSNRSHDILHRRPHLEEDASEPLSPKHPFVAFAAPFACQASRPPLPAYSRACLCQAACSMAVVFCHASRKQLHIVINLFFLEGLTWMW